MSPLPITPGLLFAPAISLFNSMCDEPFADIHHLDFFDWALLIPYFTVLVILSCYGCHRFEMIRGYFKHRKPTPAQPLDTTGPLPRVTIQLPLYNERYVVERLLEEINKMEYPREL